MNWVLQILTQLGGIAIVSAAVAWVIKSTITHYLSRDIENYKVRISNEATKGVEEFKAQLQLAAREHDVRFTKLHEKRVETLAELYELLSDANSALLQLHINRTYRDQLKVSNSEISNSGDKAFEACRTAFTFFRKHQLYFSKALAETIKQLILTIEQASASFSSSFDLEEFDKQLYQSLTEAKGPETREKIQSMMNEIEDECRSVLGSEN